MTVYELKKALENVDDNLPVTANDDPVTEAKVENFGRRVFSIEAETLNERIQKEKKK